MKYCLNYIKNTKYLNDFDEITIKFRPSDTSLVDFMLKHQHQRINIYIADNQDFLDNNRIKLFDAIKDEHPELNFVFKLQEYQEELTQKVYQVIVNDERDFQFFFRTQARDFDTFWGLVNLKPTSIYIVEALGFNIKQCAEAAHEFGIDIRVYPNVAQSAWQTTPGIMKFFIRPEDVKVYEPYVDVMEFYGDDKKVATYYRIYAKDGEWFGNLNELIISLDEDIDSRCLLPQFAERRLGCGKRCLKGHRCQICAATQHLAKTLTKNNVTIRQLSKKVKMN